MAENIDKLLLEHLGRFQGGQECIERDLREVKNRLSALESGQASLLQHVANVAVGIAGQQVSLDHLSERTDRIEYRLELA